MSATNAACSFTKKTATVTRFRVGNLWGIEPHRFPLLSPSPPSFAVAGVPRRFRWLSTNPSVAINSELMSRFLGDLATCSEYSNGDRPRHKPDYQLV